MWLGQQNVNNTVGGKEGRKKKKEKKRVEASVGSCSSFLFQSGLERRNPGEF